jgi:anaerobic ribonucleoside-triphosphate reductase activating protein
MHIGEIMTADSANGVGIRLTIFVSGCLNHCPGCFQPETWNFEYGRPYTKEMEDQLLEELAHPYYNGLTLLGGDPMELANQEPLMGLLRRIHAELPEKNIWAYTGYLYDQDLQPGGRRYIEGITDPYLDLIDILVDGPFVQELKKITLNFRGSSNQRIIDLKETRRTGELVLSPLNN